MSTRNRTNATLAKRRKKAAAYARELRADRKKNRKCWACGKRKVGISKRTGKPAKACKRCLQEDANRKATMRGGLAELRPPRWSIEPGGTWGLSGELLWSDQLGIIDSVGEFELR